MMQLSIVIPLLNEAESLPELYRWITSVMQQHGYSYEIIFVDDGSTDDSWQIISELSRKDSQVKGIKFRRNYGKSQGLNAGFKIAKGEVVITMDADLQDSPEEIPELYKMITAENYDLVSGWKKIRYDSKIKKNIPSKVFNWAARKVSGLSLHDFNCGLKAYKNQVVKDINVYGEMHRYIPFLAKNEGYINIGEKIVKHQARKYGTTKFGSDRFVKGVLDLITLWFLTRFAKRPMHLFGALGILMFLVGGMATLLILGVKAYKLYYHIPTHLVTDRPWFYIALAAMILGSQFFLAGFLGEMLLQHNSKLKRYKIDEELNI
jgi:glycosyltransferase involved in cell wall biosynthesis